MKRQDFRKLLQKEMTQFCPKDRAGNVPPKDYANAGATLVLYLLGKPEPPFQSFDSLKVSDPYTISGDPAQWKDVSHLSNSPMWQNTKDPTYFSKNNGESWYNVDADHAKQALKNVASSLNRYDPIVREKVGDDTDIDEPDEPKEPEEDPEKEDEPEKAEAPPEKEQPTEKPPTEEPPTEEPPAEESPAEEPAEKESLTKDDAKLVVKLLLQFKGKKIPKQATNRIAKNLGVTTDVIETFIYNLAGLYVQKHMIGREPKTEQQIPQVPSTPAAPTPTGPRPLNVIAREIYRDWKNVNYAAKPYLAAMGTLDSIKDNYGMDSGSSIVAYFLSNASTWRGETAKRVKAELNKMLKSR